MDIKLRLYLIDRWLIALLMLALLIAAVRLVIMDVNRPQRAMISVGVTTLERAQDNFFESTKP